MSPRTECLLSARRAVTTRTQPPQVSARRRASARARPTTSAGAAADSLRGPGQPSTTGSSAGTGLRVLIAAGGTGGHVFPAIAIADAIRSASSKVSISFVGGDRLEATAVPAAGYDFHRLPTVALERPMRRMINLLLPLRLAWAFLTGMFAVIRLRPHVVIGTGGYSAFPACLAAACLRIPLIIQEQNALPGLANRILAPFAALVCTAFEEAGKCLRAQRVLLAGNPVRRSLLNQSRGEARGRFLARHFGPSCKVLAAEGDRVVSILGGSLGASDLNAVVGRTLALLPDLGLPDHSEAEGAKLRRLWVVWQTGAGDFERVSGGFSHSRLAVTPFVARMDELYLASDLVVARAGAITCSELMATGSAALLLPSPTVADDHQSVNAEALESRGAAAALPSRLVTPEVLAAELGRLLRDEEALVEMRRAARAEARVDSAALIAAEAMRVAARRANAPTGAFATIAHMGTGAGMDGASEGGAASAAAVGGSVGASAGSARGHVEGWGRQTAGQQRRLRPQQARVPAWQAKEALASAAWLSQQLPAVAHGGDAW